MDSINALLRSYRGRVIGSLFGEGEDEEGGANGEGGEDGDDGTDLSGNISGVESVGEDDNHSSDVEIPTFAFADGSGSALDSFSGDSETDSDGPRNLDSDSCDYDGDTDSGRGVALNTISDQRVAPPQVQSRNIHLVLRQRRHRQPQLNNNDGPTVPEEAVILPELGSGKADDVPLLERPNSIAFGASTAGLTMKRGLTQYPKILQDLVQLSTPSAVLAPRISMLRSALENSILLAPITSSIAEAVVVRPIVTPSATVSAATPAFMSLVTSGTSTTVTHTNNTPLAIRGDTPEDAHLSPQDKTVNSVRDANRHKRNRGRHRHRLTTPHPQVP